MDRGLEALWLRRSAAWRKETGPYFRYMAQSGFPGFVALAVMTGIIGYIGFLKDVPAGFPIAEVGTAVLLPLLCWSPMRGYVAAADVVFLMTRESAMGPYMRMARSRGMMLGMALMLVAGAVYAPLYRHVPDGTAWPWLAAALVGLKLANGTGAWLERRMAWPAARRSYRLLRWAMAAVLLEALLTQPFWAAILFAAVALAALAAAYRFPAKHLLPWERLIAEEARTRSRYYRFFGSFIDVPTADAAVSRRAYWSWLAGRLSTARRNAFAYLYAMTLLRTELGGMLLRLTALGALVSYLAARGTALSGWAAALTAWLFALIVGVQLSALRHAHRYSVWRHVYPLPDQMRMQGMRKIVRIAHATSALCIASAAAVPLLSAGLAVPAAAAWAGAALYALLLAPASLHRRLQREETEE
jgi:ABC-2 type transport system permease protein